MSSWELRLPATFGTLNPYQEATTSHSKNLGQSQETYTETTKVKTSSFVESWQIQGT